MPAAAALPLSTLRTARMVRAPTRASSRAVTRPSPLLAPVTMTVRPAKEGRSAAVQSLMPDTLEFAERAFQQTRSQLALLECEFGATVLAGGLGTSTVKPLMMVSMSSDSSAALSA